MKCRCGKKAVIYREFEGRALCKKHFLSSVEKKIMQTINSNKLIQRNDKIAVGVSGGKDSSLLLYILYNIGKRRNDLKLEAILIDEGINGYRDVKYAKKFCEKLGIKLHTASFEKEIGKPLDEIVKNKKVKACTYCGVFRRDLLNKISRKIGASKLAIGHNMDDEVQSIMANYVRGDILRGIRLGAKAYVVKDKRFVPRIKPLRDIPEKETALYCLLKGFDADFNECPYASESFRWSIRDVVNDLEEKYPGTKYSILRTFDRLQPAIKKMIKLDKIGECKKCGEPASQKICKVCLLKKEL